MRPASGVRFISQAADTSAGCAIPKVWRVWKWVSAVRDLLLCIHGRKALRASGGVDLRNNELQVGWVAAAPVLTNNVVQLWGGFANSARDGADEPRISDAMNSRHRPVPPEYSVAFFEEGGPLPAASVADGDLGEQSSERLSVEVGNREKLLVSHASASCAVVGSGPDTVFQHRPARLFYPAFSLLSEVSA